jgi:hypothetical protein
MELALFTPGAFTWPLHRNFEGFIAALGEPVADCADVFTSPHYPARHFTELGFSTMPARTNQRLLQLHHDLYHALLRPVEFYAGSPEPLPGLFWPDLAPTPIGNLLDAFYFVFTGAPAGALSAVDGLNVLRSAFFNHEASLPELWLGHTLENLAPLRRYREELSASWTIQGGAKIRDLHFGLITECGRSYLGAAWLSGRLRRDQAGHLIATVRIGIEPGLAAEPEQLAQAKPRLEGEARAALAKVFGWDGAEAAA